MEVSTQKEIKESNTANNTADNTANKNENTRLNKPILISVMITAFISSFMGSAMNLSVPALEADFGVNAATISWVVTAYTMCVAALSLPVGKIADAVGTKKIYLLGIGGFGLTCVGCIFSFNVWMMIGLRALQGAFASMIFATNNSILIKAHPHSMQGKVLGMSVASTYVGLTLGPVLGGVFNSSFGWQSIFVLTAAVCAIAFATSARFVPADHKRPDNDRKKDYIGGVLYAVAVTMSLSGMTNLSVSLASRFIFAIGVLLIICFFLYEARANDPIMKVTMFTQSRTFTFSNLAALLNYAATFAITYNVSIYLQMVKGYESDKAGFILMAMPIMQALLSPKMGAMSDRIRPAILASGGMGLCTISLLLLSRVGTDTSLPYILIALAVGGIGFAMFSSPNTNAIMNCVDRSEYGITNSIIAIMRNYGQSTGMAVLNICTGLVLGGSSLAAASNSSLLHMMHISFTVFAGVCLLGLFCSAARDRQ